MSKTIIIGDREIEFKASAATPILYKRAFKQDLTQELASYAKNYKEAKRLQDKLNDEALESPEERLAAVTSSPEFMTMTASASELFPKLAYIMYLEANEEQRNIFGKLSEEHFIMWLSGFEPQDLQSHYSEFMQIWNGNMKSTSKQKN